MRQTEEGQRRIISKKNGFTLVELIVVLVILGILAAIMVPAMLGWIDKAKNQDAILECRNVVMAAQGQVAEIYAQGQTDDIKLKEVLQKSETLKKIMELAGSRGAVYNTIKIENSTITYLEYRTEKDIEVIYDREYNPVYRIVSDPSGNHTTNVKEHYDSLLSNMGKDEFLNDSIITQALKDKVVDKGPNRNETNENVSRVLQEYYREKVGNGDYPVVTESEKDYLKKLLGDKYISTALEGKSWRPIVTLEGNVVLAASNGDAYGAAKNTSVIYYEGHHYACIHGSTGKLSAAWVGDMGQFSISNLSDGISNWMQLD